MAVLPPTSAEKARQNTGTMRSGHHTTLTFTDCFPSGEEIDEALMGAFGTRVCRDQNRKQNSQQIKANTLDESSRPTGNTGTIYTILLMNLPGAEPKFAISIEEGYSPYFFMR